MKLAFDIETDGLIEKVSQVHCNVLGDVDTDELFSCASEKGLREAEDLGLVDKYNSINWSLRMINDTSGNTLVAHNGLSYDIPVIQKLYPSWTPADIEDTLILAKLIWSADSLMALDYPRWRKGLFPGNLIKRHSLEAWGYRLGLMKGEYAKDEGHDTKWLVWRKDMQDYCEQDVRVTIALYKLIRSHLDGTHKKSNGFVWPQEVITLEHDVQRILNDQEKVGYGFDKEAAIRLQGTLTNRQEELEDKLKDLFGSWWITKDDPEVGRTVAKTRRVKMKGQKWITKTRISEKTGKELKPYYGPPLIEYTQGATFCSIERVTFNAKSRQHLGKRLQEILGWEPTEFGGRDGKDPKLDETIIKKIPEEVLGKELKETILEYYVVTKTLGQLSDGKQNWIDKCGDDLRIHARVDPLGTVSHRAAHFSPNLGQVPGVSKDKEGNILMGWKGGFGFECRSLFVPRKGWVQVGTDASGLELRMLGHYLYPHDNGEFMKRVTTPGLDIHEENSKLVGLTREDTKTVTYTFIYGGGPGLIGSRVGVEPGELNEMSEAREVKGYMSFMRKVDKKYETPPKMVRAEITKGSRTAKKFREGISGIKDLKKGITDIAKGRKYIKAIDGRKLVVRKVHAALNLLLQGAGAIVCKVWMVQVHKVLKETYGMELGVHYNQMAWIHDELQFECHPKVAKFISQASQIAMRNTQEILGVRGDLDVDSKIGGNWAECH